MKKQKCIQEDAETQINPFDFLSEEIVFLILDCLQTNPFDRKSFSLVSKSFYSIESRHRKTLKPFPRTTNDHHHDQLKKLLNRYPFVTHLDLSLCPRIPDSSLSYISNSCGKALKSINLSRSNFFTHVGLSCLVSNCVNLVDIDLSNAVHLNDTAAAAIASCRSLERLCLTRCKSLTDIGIACIAVGCLKLRVLNLKWCLGVSDLGVALIAVKCKQIRSLDLSHLLITEKCLPLLLKLQYLKVLVLEGCCGIGDESLVSLKQGWKSLKTLNMSYCENVSHVGLSSLTSSTTCLQNLSLAYGPTGIGNSCVSLKELSLSKCSGVTDDGLSSVVMKQTELKRLDITCCRKITQASIAHLTKSCGSLVSLKMESCTLVPSGAFVLIGQHCRFLEELDLTDNDVDDEGLKSISRCSQLSVLKLGICLNISDEGLIFIGNGCPKLIELDLYRSVGIKDAGISAVAHGCPSLEMINISYCGNITDSSLISLSNCSKLNTLESRGCPLITSVGLKAIAIRCKQLTKLDIKKCFNINLSYSSVTDVGVLCLARVGCLQSLTILHMEGLSGSGLAVALLGCGGLTKVKLQSSFRSLVPRLVIEHVEARGCVFQWRDKVFEAELDPKCWKLQAQDIEF
ncbi:Leucine-rich repeat, cysteine-containing subtype [Cynara cardunculus var. scolymus]|uniref:Leucine-rich repeat, cysteine-containing subtype n=1 Tax=Cynara cardunculus var. scolymus TaxID=59895 RepID=A0A118K6W3_CYNCS|nr:Leucine-rich repeat, cysteine-containing subtype [Cynara cardunculus var. scolymus]